MVLRARLQFFAHRKETLAVHLSPVPNLNGVWGAMEQKVHLSPVPVLKPACCLDSSIKRPFYETALTNIRKDRKHPKSGSINSFRQSEFSNQQSHTSKANSNSCLRWFLVPLLPKPQYAYGGPADAEPTFGGTPAIQLDRASLNGCASGAGTG